MAILENEEKPVELTDYEKEKIEEWKDRNERCEKGNGLQIKIGVIGGLYDGDMFEDEDIEKIIIDEESMREEFEEKMKFLLQKKLFSDEQLREWFDTGSIRLK